MPSVLPSSTTITSNSLADSYSTANVPSISVGSEGASLYAGKKALSEGTLAFKPVTLHRTSELDPGGFVERHRTPKTKSSIRVRAEARVTRQEKRMAPAHVQESLGR